MICFLGMNPSVIENFISEKRIEGELCARLRNLEGDSREAVSTLIEAVNPSGNTLRELLRLADEIGSRDRTSAGAVLLSPPIAGALKTPLSRKQKQAEIRRLLEAKRYPEVAEIHRRLNQAQKDLAAATGLRVEFPPDLEGEKLTVTVAARSPGELAEAAEQLRKLAEHPATSEIYAILRGEF